MYSLSASWFVRASVMAGYIDFKACSKSMSPVAFIHLFDWVLLGLGCDLLCGILEIRHKKLKKCYLYIIYNLKHLSRQIKYIHLETKEKIAPLISYLVVRERKYWSVSPSVVGYLFLNNYHNINPIPRLQLIMTHHLQVDVKVTTGRCSNPPSYNTDKPVEQFHFPWHFCLHLLHRHHHYIHTHYHMSEC